MSSVDLARLPDPLPITPVTGPLDAVVRVPGSKSITNRALVCAALATGTSTLSGALFADDTEAMLGVLESLGFEIDADPAAARLTVTGCGGAVPPTTEQIDVRQSGTTARFALPLLALGRGSYRVTAHPQMQGRPMGTTLDTLEVLGAGVESLGPIGHLPATITASGLRSAVVQVPGDVSSQFLSGLLLVGPCLPDGLVVEVTTRLVSRPYVDMTVAVMRAFGAHVDVDGDSFHVAPGGYTARAYDVEPDASAASYPWAAAAVAGGRVRVEGLGPHTIQGDAEFAQVLGRMGATLRTDAGGTEVEVEPGQLVGGRFDLTDLSDTAPTLAVVAPFATSEVTVTGIGFIRRKESDRVAVVAGELRRCGIDVRVDADGWTIRPGRPRGAVVQTYDDHRIAMSFGLLGLVTEGLSIADPGCVAKTFPGYWDLLARLQGSAGPASRV